MKNLCPLHLANIRPMKQLVCKEYNLEVYDDFPHLSSPQYLSADQSSIPLNSEINAGGHRQTDVRPYQYWNQLDFLPWSQPDNISSLGKFFDSIEGEVNRGDDDTYRIIHFRLSQAIDECKGNIDEGTRLEICFQPPQKIKRKTKATDSDNVNRSALNHNISGKWQKRYT